MFESGSYPRLRGFLTAYRDRPDPPHALSCRGTVCIDKAACAFLAAGHARDHEIARHQGSRRGAVPVLDVTQYDIPDLASREAVQRQEVCIVGDHEQAVAGDRQPAICASSSLAQQAGCPGGAEGPDLAARSGIQRVRFVCARDVHDPVGNNRRDFQPRRAGNWKYPGRGQPIHVAGTDLFERTITIAARAAIVAQPVALWFERSFHVGFAAASKQMDFAICGLERRTEWRGTGQRAVQRAPVLEFQLRGPWLKGSPASPSAPTATSRGSGCTGTGP